MQKLLYILLFSLGCSCVHAQDLNKDFIVSFYKDIYNKGISEEQIVEKYILYQDANAFKNNVNAIKEIRMPSKETGTSYLKQFETDFLQGDYQIQGYAALKEDEQRKFAHLEPDKTIGIYKLTTKNTVAKYILMDEEKILSFFGFSKGDDTEYNFLIF